MVVVVEKTQSSARSRCCGGSTRSNNIFVDHFSSDSNRI
jgi:hypothetical protein